MNKSFYPAIIGFMLVIMGLISPVIDIPIVGGFSIMSITSKVDSSELTTIWTILSLFTFIFSFISLLSREAREYIWAAFSCLLQFIGHLVFLVVVKQYLGSQFSSQSDSWVDDMGRGIDQMISNNVSIGSGTFMLLAASACFFFAYGLAKESEGKNTES